MSHPAHNFERVRSRRSRRMHISRLFADELGQSASLDTSSHPTSSNVPSPQNVDQAYDILVDGFIAHMFTPEDASAFFTILLKTTDFRSRVSYSGGLWYKGHVQQPSPGLPTELPLDFNVTKTEGTVVPQRRWIPPDEVDIRRHVREGALQLPVFFVNRNGSVGFWLSDILQGRDRGLSNRDSHAPLGGITTTYIRIHWPGYASWRRQMPTRDETYSRNPITVGRFMKHVGTSVNKFIDHCMADGPGADPIWAIAPHGITHRHVKVIGAVHVSAGSWMPIIQLTGFVL